MWWRELTNLYERVSTALNSGRRRNMQANRRRDTKPELRLRSLLHALGLRYRCDYRIDLESGTRVRPDIVFTRRRVAVFIDGCFWHGCPEHGGQPKRNPDYWSLKLRGNRERDQRNTHALVSAGWVVLRFWEHEAPEAAARQIELAVRNRT